MQTEPNETAAAADAEPNMEPQEIAIAALDELARIGNCLTSALQLVCSVPPFRGVFGITEDGEIYELPKGGK